MKSSEQVFEEWIADEIRLDVDDGPGIVRLYTKEALLALSKHLRQLARQEENRHNPQLNNGEQNTIPPAVLSTAHAAMRQFRRVLENANSAARNPISREDEIVFYCRVVDSLLEHHRLAAYESIAEITTTFLKLAEQFMDFRVLHMKERAELVLAKMTVGV